MITSPAWRGKRYAVLGLARSGQATVRALLASGAEVVAWDSDAAKRDALSPSPLRGEGAEAKPKPLVWLLPGVDDPLEAARVAEDARLRSGTLPFSGPVPGSLPARTGRNEAEHGQRRASPQIACGVAWVLGALLGLTGWIH